ncbi:MAG: phosphotransferase family protein [Micrococcales bacterium]|uniref:phosphotransferase family protein n=1 Tax=Phycicoccus sp. TaxID=1902410 RepID=UPI0019ADABC5|nr:phosphotransferase family protein [Phycicoccus sp.]MBD3782520.1 phosphotransferase family protein [Micrococcales bacterium]HMM95800.1 phosphotransferase family protein [Phycicoccus sp.]
MSGDRPLLDLVALHALLVEGGVTVAGPLEAGLLSGGKSNLTYVVSDGVSRWVARRPPASGLTPSAHDVAREWRVTRALRHSRVPVAPTVVLCEDPSVFGAPVAVVEYVEGQVVRTRPQLRGHSSDELRACTDALVGVLADLHAVDVDEVELDGFGRPEGFLERQVGLWWRQWTKVRQNDLPDATQLHRVLRSALPTTPGAVGIVHGDYRIDNTLLAVDDITTVLAVVDWELATIGDVLTDVALMAVYRQPELDAILGVEAAWASDRLPSGDDLAHSYALMRGVDLPHWPFYLALANFKLAVIAQGISYRARQGAAADASAAGAEEAVPELLAAGLRALRTD